MIKRVLLLTSLVMGLHNSLWAVAANGTYDFSGFTDPGNDLISTDFILSGTVDGLVGNMTLQSPLAYGGNDASVLDSDVCVYKLTADGSNTASFVVTDVNLRDFSTSSSNDNFYLVGNVAGAGTVQSVNTLTGLANNGVQDVITGSALDLTPFAGVQVTSFEVRFTASTSCENLDFNSFTISNVLAPSSNTAPTSSNLTQTVNFTEDVSPVPIADMVVVDPDADTWNATVTMAAGNNSLGSLSATSGNGESFNTTTGVWSISSANKTAVNTALAAMSFTPPANGSTSTTALTSITDGVSTPITGTITFSGTPIADTPSVTNTSTNEDTQTASGLVVSRNVVDGAEVMYFKITNISGGALYKNDGTTAISNNAFITFAEANAGLKFTPTANSSASGSFDVQGATDNLGGGLSSGSATATITVTAVGDAPSVTGAVTIEDAQSSSGLVITKNTADGAEVTHYKVTNISGGALYKNDGTTAILNNDFITVAEGTAGLKFTPAANSSASGSFDVQAGIDNLGSGLGTATTATVTVLPVNDAPTLGGTFTTAGTINDNATIAPFGAVTVSDIDSVNASATITYTVANGTLAGTGLTGTAGNYTLSTITLATLQSRLQALLFTPTPNQVAVGSTVVTSFSLTLTDDSGSATATGLTNATTQITATSINDVPTITSDGSGATAAVNAAENQTAVTTVSATDSDVAAVLTYSISGGADQLKFAINGTTGVLTFLVAPDFEIPGDVGADNVYEVQVTASDSVLTDMQAIAVTVTDVYDTDSDSDTIYDNADNCVNTANTDQLDSDGDSIGDACDAFAFDSDNDIDGDTISGHIDNCPVDANFDQLDTDGDGMGDVCDAFVNNDLNSTPSVTAPAGASTFINAEGNNEMGLTQSDGTATAAITYPSDGTTGHSVTQPDGTVTSARFMAPGADIVINDNGDVNSSLQVNGVYINVQATSDGNTTHQLSIEINGTIVTTEATVGFGGANTLVDADGSIETNVTLADVNSTLISYVINAEINGNSSYRVHGGDFNTTVHTSVLGASTYLGADGNITLATPALNVNGNMVEALVTTNAQGESYTYFRVTKPDLSVIITPTLNAINRFEPGNSVIINDFDGFYEFIVQTPLNAPLLF